MLQYFISLNIFKILIDMFILFSWSQTLYYLKKIKYFKCYFFFIENFIN